MTQQIVYVVDDEQGMLDSTVWLLESIGLTVHAFTSGQEFLQKCDPNACACVILDVRMPGLSGLNVQESMRQQNIHLPVIFVSGHADVPIVVRAFRAGAVDFIEKPYNEQLLLDSVQSALTGQAYSYTADARLAVIQRRLDSLTPREKDVLLPLVKGFTNREIAEQLSVSVKTIDLYRSRVMKHMQASTLPDLVGMVIAAGLVDPLNWRG